MPVSGSRSSRIASSRSTTARRPQLARSADRSSLDTLAASLASFRSVPSGRIGCQGTSRSTRHSGTRRMKAWGIWSERMWIEPLEPISIRPKGGCLSPASRTLEKKPIGPSARPHIA